MPLFLTPASIATGTKYRSYINDDFTIEEDSVSFYFIDIDIYKFENIS
jgi:hypothetical protein